MSNYSVVQDPTVEFWDSFSKSSGEGNYFQSYEFGEILKTSSPKTKISRIGVNFNGKPVGIAQGTYTSYLGFGMTLQVIRGPMVSPEMKDSLELLSYLIKGLEDTCKNKRIVRLEIWSLDSLKIQDMLLKTGYSPVSKINDYVINLEQDPQNLWAKIHHNKRRNIKTAAREGVEIVQSRSPEALETFCSLHEAAAKRDGFVPVPRAWFEAASKVYKPETWCIFLANWNSKSIAGVFVVIHGSTVYALRAGSLTEGLKVRPNDLMHWKAMEWACINGYSKYNMGMVDEPTPTVESTKWGIWRWKKEWNGYLERIEILDKTVLPQYKRVLQARNAVYGTIKRFQ